MYRYIPLVFLISFLYSLSSPVEAARKKKEAVPEKSEETIFMETYFPERPCREWETGRKFIYLDDDLSPLIQPQTISLGDSSYRGKIFIYEGLVEASPWRKGTVNLEFACEGRKYYFKTGKSEEEIMNSSYTPLLPMLVSDEDISKARQLLVGKTLYTRPATWVDSIGNTSSNRRYCPVKIVDIQPGNSIYPIAFVFEDEMVVDISDIWFPDTDVSYAGGNIRSLVYLRRSPMLIQRYSRYALATDYARSCNRGYDKRGVPFVIG